LRQKSRQDDARAVLQEAVRIDPDDAGARYELVTVLIALGDVDGARVLATEAQHLRDLARLLTERGDADGALAMLARAAEGDPDDGGTRASLAQAYAARGEWERAGAFLPQDVAVADPAFRLLAAEILLRVGRTGQALALLEGLADKDAGALSALAERLAAEHPGAAFTCAEVVADRAAVRQDWDAAAAALTAFVARVPHHVLALMKLVEIWVDAGLDERVTAAQAQLADAYLMSGSGNEARVIAEDLLVRNPENEAYRDRLRQTLILLGEPDPDRALTERLNGASVFVAPDLDLGDLVPHEDSVPPPQPAASDDEFEVQRHEPARQAPASILPRVSAGEDPTVERIFELSAGAIDVTSLLSEQDFAGGMGEAWDESPDAIEVDLSAALDGLQAANVPRRTHGAIPEDDLDGVFRGMRDEADRATAGGAAPEQYRRAVECEASGRDDEAVALLAQAARSPRLRFEAGGRLARLLARHGRRSQAVEWFERAAQAPAPTADAGLALLYDLGLALEGGGEWARALAIYLELQSEAGAYRDVVERVDRLSKSGMRG
ncbi:MAG TPA: tetratricopeptide repeat protein, partial [Vicinamibacterales bacterium]|nr:tetratricopeptide repeat protein [Vicinamibacterales bacterium]